MFAFQESYDPINEGWTDTVGIVGISFDFTTPQRLVLSMDAPQLSTEVWMSS
jgi:hypothetical protein